MSLEHDVNLAIGSTLHLRQVEVGCCQAERTSCSPCKIIKLALRVLDIFIAENFRDSVFRVIEIVL